MEANIKWVEGDTFIGRSQSGHNVVFDTGSDSAAPSPMEMVLMSTGCCSSVDVVSILKKAKQQDENTLLNNETVKKFFNELNNILNELPEDTVVVYTYGAWDLLHPGPRSSSAFSVHFYRAQLVE